MNVRNGIENMTGVFPSQTSGTAGTARSNNLPSAGMADDRAQLSAAATLAAQTASVPDVRLDKVASIQSALQAGTYHVSTADIAQAVLDSMLSTEK